MNKYAQDVIDRARVWRSIQRMEKSLGQQAPQRVRAEAAQRLADAVDAYEQSRVTPAQRQAMEALVKHLDRGVFVESLRKAMDASQSLD